jgi:hypothetical protein
MDWTYGRMKQVRHSYGDLFGNREGKQPPGRPKRRWEDMVGSCGLHTSASG